ncbi:hypothetical protein GQ457_06G024770 [Hibiscus cannabinus]
MNNNNNKIFPETVISVPHTNFDLSYGDLERLRSLDRAFEGDQHVKPTTKPLIQRLPSTLGIPDDFIKYFKPRVISIGPIHHADSTLHESEQLKLRLAAHFVKNVGLDKEILYGTIKSEIGSLKECYDPKVLEPYDDEKLAWMLFLDGCAILQAILQGSYHYESTYSSSKMMIKHDLLTFVYLDMFLLENQLPYRVLELLINNSSDTSGLSMRLIDLFIEENVIFPAEIEQLPRQKQQEGEPVHLLDHLRKRLILKKEKNITLWERLGIMCHLKRNQSPHGRRFQPHMLHGKTMAATDHGGRLDGAYRFMNLIAYEMCPDFENDFTVTSYICFLDDAGDVKVLKDDGVLYNVLGSDEEVANLFNKMSTLLVPSPEIYVDVKLQVEDHCRRKWIRLAAQAYLTYFSSPWAFIAFMGANAALLLSALQTYYTIISVK